MPTLLLLILVAVQASGGQKPFVSTYSAAELAKKQAVVETSMGSFVIELYGDKAPNHVGYFMKTARDGGYTGTLIHRVVKYGIIQGGDPLSRDASKPQLWGSGGMNALKGEINAEPMTAGAVGAALVPGKPDSGGAQFFVCATDQPTLQGQFTVFGRVVEGLDLVQKISAVPADANGRPAERIVIKSVTIRETPPPVKEPFVDATPAELAKYRVVLETTRGEIELEFITDKAPETTRQVLRLAAAGVYDGTPFHRVVPNFVIQTGAVAFRDPAASPAQAALVKNLQPEFSETPNAPGLVSMARGDDPASATTSFFICTGQCSSLNGKYTAFARVVRGMDVVQAIAATPVDGETPKEKIVLTRARIVR